MNPFWAGTHIGRVFVRRYLRLAVEGLSLLFVLFLYGCPLMMPFMMGPMLSDTTNRLEEFNMDKTLTGLVNKGVTELSARLVTYDRILLGDTIIKGNLVPKRKFRDMLLEELRSRNAWLVFDKEEPSPERHRRSQSLLAQNQEPAALVSTRLYQTDNRLWLAIELRDSRFNRLLWSGSN